MSLLQLAHDKVWNPFHKHVLELRKTTPTTSGKKWYFGETSEHADTGNLSRSKLGQIAILEPMIRKGIWKENKDIFGEGWEIIHKDPEMDVDEKDLDLIKEFDKKAMTKYKMEQAGISGNIYGDGFIEIVFEEQDQGVNDLIGTDVPMTAPVDLTVLNAEYIEKTEKKDGVDYYIYQSSKSGRKRYMHPNRILHVVKKRLPGYLFGISDVYTCNRTLQSKMNADTYFGEFIEWAGKGVFDLTLTNANSNDIKEAERTVKRRNVQIHDQDSTWQVLNPVTMSPKEFYDYFFINIAATMDMPQHILTGVQPGQLTGSEIGLADYYKNIMNLQELVFTPLLERVYKHLLEANGRSFDDYEICWNPIFVDELSESQILKLRAEAGALAMDRFAIDENEYRMILKEGITDLEGDIVLDKEPPSRPIQPPAMQPMKPQDIPVETQHFYVNLLTKEEKIRLENEKLRGKLELELQEKRLKEAKELKEHEL